MLQKPHSRGLSTGDVPSEVEGVLVLGEDRLTLPLQLAADAIQKSRMIQLPSCCVKGVGYFLIAPGLVVRPELRSPMTGVLSYQQLRQPSHPDIQTSALYWHLCSPALAALGCCRTQLVDPPPGYGAYLNTEKR